MASSDFRRLTPRQYLHLRYPDAAVLLDRIATCESGWKMVKNPTSSAYGLFQIIDSTERLTPQYALGLRKTDPYVNVDMAYWLLTEGGGSGHWYPSESCWSR